MCTFTCSLMYSHKVCDAIVERNKKKIAFHVYYVIVNLFGQYLAGEQGKEQFQAARVVARLPLYALAGKSMSLKCFQWQFRKRQWRQNKPKKSLNTKHQGRYIFTGTWCVFEVCVCSVQHARQRTHTRSHTYVSVRTGICVDVSVKSVSICRQGLTALRAQRTLLLFASLALTRCLWADKAR